ncbi:hypothetical protein CIK84_11455 [Glutamicibacter arilaitensis]|uniref:Uncharacterized protein n=1 Tax=Glutamicibacter arilaitensis TaxID=256701 RepID=A0A2N7RZK4_9MICC|nr:hypothetical protein CIK84_11455 [Glutamicibacter arilaitensis]
MNRYISSGLAQDATEGKHVIFCGMATEAREAFYQVAAIAEDIPSEIRRANGYEVITFPSGGSARFMFRKDQLRNNSADVIYLSDPNEDWITEALIAVSTRSGEVIRP